MKCKKEGIEVMLMLHKKIKSNILKKGQESLLESIEHKKHSKLLIRTLSHISKFNQGKQSPD
jgi:hypothetical protein